MVFSPENLRVDLKPNSVHPGTGNFKVDLKVDIIYIIVFGEMGEDLNTTAIDSRRWNPGLTGFGGRFFAVFFVSFLVLQNGLQNLVTNTPSDATYEI